MIQILKMMTPVLSCLYSFHTLPSSQWNFSYGARRMTYMSLTYNSPFKNSQLHKFHIIKEVEISTERCSAFHSNLRYEGGREYVSSFWVNKTLLPVMVTQSVLYDGCVIHTAAAGKHPSNWWRKSSNHLSKSNLMIMSILLLSTLEYYHFSSVILAGTWPLGIKLPHIQSQRLSSRSSSSIIGMPRLSIASKSSYRSVSMVVRGSWGVISHNLSPGENEKVATLLSYFLQWYQGKFKWTHVSDFNIVVIKMFKMTACFRFESESSFLVKWNDSKA